MFLKKIMTFDRVFRTCVGGISVLAALDMTTIIIRVNDNSMHGYSQGDYVIGMKHFKVKEGDVAVIVDPFENREKVRRVVATKTKFIFYNDNNKEGGQRARRRGRNIFVPTAHWWCESDIPDSSGALDSCAVHERMIEAKVVLKYSNGSFILTQSLLS